MFKCDIANKKNIIDVLKSDTIKNIATKLNLKYEVVEGVNEVTYKITSDNELNTYAFQHKIREALTKKISNVIKSYYVSNTAYNTIVFTDRNNSFIKGNLPEINKSIETFISKDNNLNNDSILITPGVSELFESNPELANAVYSKILTNSGLSSENLLSLLLKDNLIEKQCS